MPVKALEFSKVLVWVQVHDIPVRFMNRKVAKGLCKVVGLVCSRNDAIEMDGGSFMRVRVLIDKTHHYAEGDIFLPRGNKVGFLSNIKDYPICAIGVDA